MSKRMRQRKRMLSLFVLIAMLLNFAIPQSLTLVHAAANLSQQSVSNGPFDAKEVNRILDGLTPEQKASINKLTGAENSQKIHVNQKDLRSSKNINVIVQFKVDPAKIQIIKQSLAKGGASVNSQAFAADYSEAQKKVADSHAKFKSFVNAQPKTQIIGGIPVKSSMQIIREYSEAFNGVAFSLPANQVEAVANNQEVASVWSVETFEIPEKRNTFNSTETSGSEGKPTSALKLLGLDKLQAEGHTGIIKNGPNAGKKVKVGVLDTGIDYNHPDLYKGTHDANGNRYGGHDFVNHEVNSDGSVTFVDDNDPMETIYSDWLDAKAKPSPLEGPPPSNYKSYITSHGTHVSGTIAANTTNNNATYSANGVAPDVELHGYRVLGPGGRGYADGILNGIDQSVKDGMQVINLSLGSRNNDPLYPTSIAINNATLAGVTCIVSAGNAGPGIATVGSPGTSALAVTIGASTIPVEIPVMTIKNGTAPYQARLFGKNFADNDDAFGGQTFPIVDVGLGSTSEYNGKDMTGKIALVKRGGDLLTTKMANAKNAGAKGMIIWNNTADPNTQGYPSAFLGVNMDNIYSVSLTQAQGQALSDSIASDPSAATITFPSTLDTPIYKNADELADFSSTGPVKNWDIKPDVISPGVDIISTVPFDVWEPQEGQTHDYTYAYESMSGTSMAAPHTSGIAALILAAHPDYRPADIKAALMNTAKDVNKDSKTYSVYQVGAGRVDPVRAINAYVKIQVLDKTYSFDDPRYIYANNPTIKQIDHLTGSIFFGFKGRGEGATNGSDDVVSSKDFNVINQGTNSKTFNVSTKYITTKFAGSNEVGPGTGNDVKIDVSVNNVNTTAIEVGGGSTVKATAKITVPSNALEGTYEGYINLVNATDSTESYRIPFTITVAEKGIDFKVDIKAMTLGEKDTGNYNPQSGLPASGYYFSVNGAMETNYIVLKDNKGNYLGVVSNLGNISAAGPGTQYGPYLMLVNGLYLPFTKPYNGSLDQSGIATTPANIKEGAYSLEMIATDAAGKQYTAEDTLYVDYKAPTITMDADSKPGIYEIDPTGYQPGQEVKGFYGTIYDSNVDVMKDNGETSVPGIDDHSKPAPVDQALSTVWGYQDSSMPTVLFSTDANGRFHFGLSTEDITPQGSNFWIFPSDYSGAGDVNSTATQYYFIKKGSPYLTYTVSDGVDQELESQGKVVAEPNKPFKIKVALKNGIGMTGGTFTFDGYSLYSYSNIRLSEEYKAYLASKGVTDPKLDVNGTTVTISGIDAIGALDGNMDIIEADITLTKPTSYFGPLGSDVTGASFTLNGKDTALPAFQANWAFIKQPTSMITGGLFAEAFKANTLSGSFTNITVESGAKVTVKDITGKSFATDNPTSTNNTVQYMGNMAGTYAVSSGVSDKPYSVALSMPGHFKGYLSTPVIGSNRYGYQSGSNYDIPSYMTPLLSGGDVNGDNVIDMNDLLAEVGAYNSYKALTATADKKAFLTNPDNRKYDIRWISTNSYGGYGIDYYDFYYIFKNFGQQNQSAIDAGISVPTPQLTLTADTMVNGVQLKAGDGVDKVRAALNFAGPTQKTLSTTIPKLDELQKGSSITLIPTDNVYKDDVVWRNAITEIHLNGRNVTNALIPNSSDKAVSIAEGYYYFDPMTGPTFVPAKITLHGSLYLTKGTYTVLIKAAGYQDVSVQFTVAETPIPTPTIPMVTDPTKAHLGKDITLTFTEDANWRNGINKIVVKTANFTTGVDITNIVDGSSNKYYDISQPGQITFNKEVFKTNATTVINTSPIEPGGANYLPQQYKFEIYSTGTDGTIYPMVTAGTLTGDTGLAANQAVGYSLTFDTQGGAALNPIAVGYRPGNSRYGTKSSDFPITTTNPAPTRPGYKFLGWYNEPTCITVFDQFKNLTADKTVYAKWEVAYTQNYSPIDKTKPNGLKFDGAVSGVSGKGWVLGEGNLEITLPDYKTNTTLTDKASIGSIKAEYYKVLPNGTTDKTLTSYTLDPSTYEIRDNSDGSATLSFTTATAADAAKAGQTNPGQKFAFSDMPSNTRGNYKLTITPTTGTTIVVPNVLLGYRLHVDLNGGTLKNPTDTYFVDRLISSIAAVPGAVPDIFSQGAAIAHVTNGNLSVSPKYYFDSVGTSGNTAPFEKINDFMVPNESLNLYLCWIKTPPSVSKDTVGNTVGSDITLTFTDDGTWKNNINKISIGSKVLVKDSDYTITNNAITLDKSLFTAGQKVNVTISSEGYVDALVLDQLIGYMITFESNGGVSVPAQIVDSHVTKPADPELVGYKFVGWYTDQQLTTLFDFASIVTKPLTLFAKYALAGANVSPDSKDNALGNEITLEFSDAEWAKAISGIKVNGTSVEGTKFKVDSTLGTITLDKSLFTKTGDFNISISAKDYADITVIQKVLNGYNVHFVLDNAPFEVKDQIFTRRITEPVVYGYDLTWFADEAHTIPWDFTSSIYSAKTLYGKWSLHKFNVIFDRQDDGLVESKTADYNTTITAPTVPTRPGYAFLGWYKDAAGQMAWNFAKYKVTSNVILYAKWVKGVENNGYYNNDVIITFNEATAKLDGKEFTSGTEVSSEGSHTLVVTDASGNATTVKFTIDYTAPKAPIVNKVTSTATSVTGTAEADTTILIKAGTKTLGTGTVDKTGKFTVSIVKQKVSTHLYVTALDKAGNESSATKVTVSK